jgi:hypothetical protein
MDLCRKNVLPNANPLANNSIPKPINQAIGCAEPKTLDLSGLTS